MRVCSDSSAMAISNDSIQKLLSLLRPYLRNESERRAYLIRALGTNIDALNLIWNEPVNTFVPNMVQKLVVFGEVTPGQPALFNLLKVIREDMGFDSQIRLDELLEAIRKELPQNNNDRGNWRNASDNTSKEIDFASPRLFTTASGFLGDDWNKLERDLNAWLSQASGSIEIEAIESSYSLSGAKVLVYFKKKTVEMTKEPLKALVFHGLTDSSVGAALDKYSKTKLEILTSNTASLGFRIGAFAIVVFCPVN